MLNDGELRSINNMINRATKGSWTLRKIYSGLPWKVTGKIYDENDNEILFISGNKNQYTIYDAKFIVGAKYYMPLMLKEIRELRKENKGLKQLFEKAYDTYNDKEES